MKKANVLIAAAAAAAGIAYYFIRKRRSTENNGFNSTDKPAHHMTDVFARAKEQAVK